MSYIVPGITTLAQHKKLIKTDLYRYRPPACPHCQCTHFHFKGFYERKPDRGSRAATTLNPIQIPRWWCTQCHHTTSALPEVLPPRHWYTWTEKAKVLQHLLDGHSIYQWVKVSVARPVRSTLSRWWSQWCRRWSTFRHQLMDRVTGYGIVLADEAVLGWRQLLSCCTLAKAMRWCHERGLVVP